MGTGTCSTHFEHGWRKRRAIQIGLGLFQTLKAFSLERCSLRVADGGFDSSFAIRILDPARHGHTTVVGEHIAIEWFKLGS